MEPVKTLKGTPASLAPTLSAIRRATSNTFALLPRRWYRVTWCCVFLLHLACLAFFGAISFFYKTLPGTYLADCLDYYSIGMPTTFSNLFAWVHGILAACHALALVLMLAWSLRTCRLSLGPQQEYSLVDMVHNAVLYWNTLTQSSNPQQPRRRTTLASGITKIVGNGYVFLCSRRGVFGVEGRHFDAVLLAREIIETALQTVQAHQMSRDVPRVWLNRFCITLLVLNYWSTAFLSILPLESIMLRRMMWLLFDLILDFVSSVGVPAVLLLSYAQAYMEFQGFNSDVWTDDTWFVHAVSEFPLILIDSWSNLASRVIISLSFLSCLESVKRIVREAEPTARTKVSQIMTASPKAAAQRRGPTMAQAPSFVPIGQTHAWRRKVTLLVYGLFVVCGSLVLCSHVFAEIKPTLSDCAMQVRPWWTTDPACKLVHVDCSRKGHLGQVDDLRGAFGAPDPAIVTHILIRRCPHLEMSPLLQRFANINTLKIYNSTIARWGSDAALTTTHHPLLQSLYLIRVNTTDGHLPVGITDIDTPQSWLDIELVKTNIYELPEDLHTKWLPGGTLFLEASEFHTFPSVLLKLRPLYLWFAGNHLTEFPFEVFQMPELAYFSISGNPITSLHPDPYRDIVDGGSLVGLEFGYTSVSKIPKWLDPFITRFRDGKKFGLRAPATPLCERLAEMEAHNSTHFTVNDVGNHPSLSSDAFSVDLSNDTLDTITKFLHCERRPVLFYNLTHEDTISTMPTSGHA